jgi:hypothetical protein
MNGLPMGRKKLILLQLVEDCKIRNGIQQLNATFRTLRRRHDVMSATDGSGRWLCL